MSVFFNGRLWVTPAVMSLVDDSALFNKNLDVGNVLVVIGRSTGGRPNFPLRFGSPAEALAMLRDGDLCDAIQRAFDPSAQTGAPATVIGMRVNPALQSAATLVDGASANAIGLQSQDYGLWTNQIKVKIESGTNTGKKITTQVGNDYYTGDDIARRAFSILYSGGQASSRMSINNTTLTLEAPNSTVVATIDLNAYPTIQQLVDRINAVSGFAAAVLDGNGAKPALNGLDSYTNQDVKTGIINVAANLQACVDWFNSNADGFVTATRAGGAGAVPANIPFTYMIGGTDGSVTNTEWQNCFTTLQAEDVQWVVPLSSSPSIHAMTDAHVAFMSNVALMERRAIVGTPSATTDVAAIALAKAINSDRTSMVHLGMYDYNAAGALTLFEPMILAAMIGGAFSGVNPGTALTNKSLKLRGLERKLRNPTDTDPLILGGLMAVEDTPRGFKVTKSISTWLINTNYNRVEQSVGWALDFTARNVRDALQNLKGAKGSPITLAQAVNRTESALRELARQEPQGPGVLVGDATNPPYKNIRASLEGDVMRVEFQCSPVIPVNYIPVSIFAVPFSGSATAA